MRRIVATYLLIMIFVSLGFFGIGALASAAELRDPMQPPPFALLKYRQAKQDKAPQAVSEQSAKPPPKPLLLTSILFSPNRKVAIIDDQMLSIGDRIRGAKLVKITRTGARLVRRGKEIKLELGNERKKIRKIPLEASQ